MINARLLAVAMVLAAAGCGGTKANDTTPYTGTFSIQGAPHGGLYDQCETSSLPVGNSTTISCLGLPGCADCGMVATVPLSGSGSCKDGSASVSILKDPGIASFENSAQAGCSPVDQQTPTPVPGDPNPGCPNDLHGCNRVVGDCTVIINSVDPKPDVQNPFGHFSGSIEGTVWSSTKNVDCGVYSGATLEGDGTMYAISIMGAW